MLRPRPLQADGDGTRARAQVDRQALVGEQFDGPAGEHLGLPAGHVDAVVHEDPVAGEVDRTGHPGQRLACHTARHELLQEPGVVPGRRRELVGFVARRDAPSGGEPGGESAAGGARRDHPDNLAGAAELHFSGGNLPDAMKQSEGRAPSGVGLTHTQLRAFAAVVRLGSVKEAAAQLGVSEPAVSLLMGQLRRELSDQLFTRTSSGLAFTPGGLRLASRASELLDLRHRTITEVSQAAQGRRLMRVAASSLFAEHAAPGLIELFASRANDLDVELSVRPPDEFDALLASRAVDVALGPKPASLAGTVVHLPFLNYQIVVVAGPGHPLAKAQARPAQLREQTWLLGPSAAGDDGVVRMMLRRFDVPESRQRIFQSHAAALEETMHNEGLSLALSVAVADDLAHGRLARVAGPGVQAEGTWEAMRLPDHSVLPAAAELVRFIITPRATAVFPTPRRRGGCSISRLYGSIGSMITSVTSLASGISGKSNAERIPAGKFQNLT